jgi:hypothetical protein
MRTVVAGSYPPVPRPAAAATLAAVRAALAAGDDVLVVSPRASAAHRRASLRGWRAVVALARLSRGRQRLILVAEPDMPFSEETDHGAAVSLGRVARTLYGGLDVWLIDPIGLPVRPIAALVTAADRVLVASDADREAATRRWGLPADRVTVDQRALPHPSHVGLDVSRVTPSGPLDWTPREQPRRIASAAIRRVLGTHTDVVRAQVVKGVSAGRRAREAVRRRLARTREQSHGLGPPP